MYQHVQPNAASAGIERHLLLIHQPGAQAKSDFEAIAALVRERAPDIEVFIASNETPSSVTRRQAARRPTLAFTPLYLRHFIPNRGKVYAGRPMTKHEQLDA